MEAALNQIAGQAKAAGRFRADDDRAWNVRRHRSTSSICRAPIFPRRNWPRSLNRIPAGRQLVVDMTSASGGAIATLKKENRIVITATKTGTEKNATVFARYWVDALRDPAADVDKNETISALEAFNYAEKKTADFYTDQKRLATEHPQVDDQQRASAFPLFRFGAAAAVVNGSGQAGAGHEERRDREQDRRIEVPEVADGPGRVQAAADRVADRALSGAGGHRQMRSIIPSRERKGTSGLLVTAYSFSLAVHRHPPRADPCSGPRHSGASTTTKARDTIRSSAQSESPKTPSIVSVTPSFSIERFQPERRARISTQEALKIDPKNADALLGVAQILADNFDSRGERICRNGARMRIRSSIRRTS